MAGVTLGSRDQTMWTTPLQSEMTPFTPTTEWAEYTFAARSHGVGVWAPSGCARSRRG
jgi:hypothetical protein